MKEILSCNILHIKARVLCLEITSEMSLFWNNSENSTLHLPYFGFTDKISFKTRLHNVMFVYFLNNLINKRFTFIGNQQIP